MTGEEVGHGRASTHVMTRDGDQRHGANAEKRNSENAPEKRRLKPEVNKGTPDTGALTQESQQQNIFK